MRGWTGFALLIGILFPSLGLGHPWLSAIRPSEGSFANGRTTSLHFSAGGRYVAFASEATNWVSDDPGGQMQDVFWMDRLSGEVRLISRGMSGEAGNGSSLRPHITPDGRYVAFSSEASNLVPDDSNAVYDAFLYDATAKALTLVSRAANGSAANGPSYSAGISDDGNHIAITSDASNLVAGDTNRTKDAFVFSRTTGSTTRVSLGPNGEESRKWSGIASLSGNGRYAIFWSDDKNFAPGDTNDFHDLFRRDLLLGTTTLVSWNASGVISDEGSSAEGDVSADGRYVAFASSATNLAPGEATSHLDDVFVKDMLTGDIRCVSRTPAGLEPDAQSVSPQISGDGRYTVFQSLATNLDTVGGPTQSVWCVYIHDASSGVIRRIDRTNFGVPGNKSSWVPSISPDGRWVGFESDANNLVPGLAGQGLQYFIVDRFAHAFGWSVPARQTPSPRRLGYWTTTNGVLTNWVRIGNVAAGWYLLGFADVQGDGKDDALLVNLITQQIGAWLLDGATIKGWLSLPRYAPGWFVVGIGDVDNNGSADIIVRQEQGDRNGAYLLQNGSYRGWLSLPATGDPVIDVADLNGDGHLDLITMAPNWQIVAIWMVNGVRVGARLLFRFAEGYSPIGFGDFNDDRHPDLMVSNSNFGTMGAYLLGPSGNVIGWQMIGRYGSGWTPFAPALLN